MFTGLVETIGVLRRRSGGAVARALIEANLGPLSLGESISVNGACLTVDRIAPGGFECDMSSETLRRTTLGALPVGARVHLERATPLGARMGGHVVLGHVDGLGRVAERSHAGDAIRLSMSAPPELAAYLAPKGSIAVDGASLTINAVSAAGAASAWFEVMLVPHTIERTLLGELRPGTTVNLEVDVLARYVARQLEVASLVSLRSRSSGDAREGDDERGNTGEHADHDERLLAKLRAGGFW
ncbi:riboflavin synthase subunit alpha [Sorangium cellulosum]|uniref:Riboflavin synthase n=1 Tax=Sorangium cellulosum TaxID=56 RepID=A0A2L0F6P7_SORCE|nr:riboflavin synthase [Sorangium cellulosum]AUX47109.1 riboflavin synthase subunit alpha [Sorangium cellulosum]